MAVDLLPLVAREPEAIVLFWDEIARGCLPLPHSRAALGQEGSKGPLKSRLNVEARVIYCSIAAALFQGLHLKKYERCIIHAFGTETGLFQSKLWKENVVPRREISISEHLNELSALIPISETDHPPFLPSTCLLLLYKSPQLQIFKKLGEVRRAPHPLEAENPKKLLLATLTLHRDSESVPSDPSVSSLTITSAPRQQKTAFTIAKKKHKHNRGQDTEGLKFTTRKRGWMDHWASLPFTSSELSRKPWIASDSDGIICAERWMGIFDADIYTYEELYYFLTASFVCQSEQHPRKRKRREEKKTKNQDILTAISGTSTSSIHRLQVQRCIPLSSQPDHIICSSIIPINTLYCYETQFALSPSPLLPSHYVASSSLTACTYETGNYNFQSADAGNTLFFRQQQPAVPGICPSGKAEGLDEKTTRPIEDSCKGKKGRRWMHVDYTALLKRVR
ncbi:hypothetical protein MBM_03216 [Drepanopeziza brunnea f. sp. 'multigermtubi' MB_m1]|uniref:Uncharacterized protein n=1 Tax=Marssonina brunnea f. sp. multigermtubi (strain MB_m1) TaxID=1072389 RepID=K1Y1F5_MARBU|nr:uncharacterized protein MBM_03216 [Drepanopeziza brunnea f. sp. 'multigermtubi' MB_m1]EKD18974.1 hypothetical protein MBM_03216 [Drepanopeziza brunnea f. sp. 'multigermtubi' MB_m1]